MINYRRETDTKPHSVFRDDNQSLLFEHCFTRDGFDGPFSILYNEAPHKVLVTAKQWSLFLPSR